MTSLHNKTKPGKLDDFVPEVDRSKEFGYSTLGSRGNYEETRTIRNYELLGAKATQQPETVVPQVGRTHFTVVPHIGQ